MSLLLRAYLFIIGLIFDRSVAQPGSAPEWGSGGPGFKSPRSDNKKGQFCCPFLLSSRDASTRDPSYESKTKSPFSFDVPKRSYSGPIKAAELAALCVPCGGPGFSASLSRSCGSGRRIRLRRKIPALRPIKNTKGVVSDDDTFVIFALPHFYCAYDFFSRPSTSHSFNEGWSGPSNAT
jgi:hypothetical protein